MAGAPGEIHLLGGDWKRSRLPVRDAPGLRPTPVRLRQTLFDWVCSWWLLAQGHSRLEGCRVVDAFAGSGALGLEAASRGAGPVLLVEADAALARSLQATCERLKAGTRVTVRRGDALAVLRGLPPASVDLLLIDPPFGTGLQLKALQAGRAALSADARVHLEADRRHDDAELAALDYRLLRHRQAGAVHAHLLAPGAPAAGAGGEVGGEVGGA